MKTKEEIRKPDGKLGVLIPGIGGAVSTTFLAGVESIRRGLSLPIGSLSQMGTVRLGKRFEYRIPLIKDFVPLANLDDLVVLVGGESLDLNPDPSLINPYAVIPVNPAVHPQTAEEVAMQFIEWITSLETQQQIAVFGVECYGQPLFFPDSDQWRSAHP